MVVPFANVKSTPFANVTPSSSTAMDVFVLYSSIYSYVLPFVGLYISSERTMLSTGNAVPGPVHVTVMVSLVIALPTRS